MRSMQLRWSNLLKSVLGQLGNLAVLAALFGLLAWGHLTHWKAPKFSSLFREPAAEKSPSLPHDGAPADSPAVARSNEQAPALASVRLASKEAVIKSGIELSAVERRPMTQEVVALGMVTYDQTRIAQLSARVSGTVWSVQKNVGQAIKKGETLAIIEAREVGRVKAEFLQAVVDEELKTLTLARMKSVPSAMSERRIREAEAEEREAHIRLFNAQQTLVNLGLPIRLEDVANLHDEELVQRVHFLGLPDSLVKTLDPETTTANLIPLIAPFDGVVIGREIVTGELVDPSSGAQIVVADVSRMWIELDVRKEDAAKLRLGQDAVFTVDGVPGEIRSHIAWISTELDSRTHTVQARLEVENPLIRTDAGPDGQRLLRANMFGVAHVLIHAKPHALAVPSAAIQRDGAAFIVFVNSTKQTFQPRVVEVGITDDDFTEILSGVSEGESVAAAGSHVLKAEILKTRLATGGL
jgi:cobalt-zinc-cadmium efflux system membrane fusion protein